jgi:thiol:disulfide interchange protein DsbG
MKKLLTRVLLTIPLAALVASAYTAAAWADTPNASDTKLPEPIASMADRGLEIVGSFDAPSGLTGYAATFQGRPIAIYLTEDSEHAVLGTLIDSQGKDLTAEPLQRIVSGPQAEKAWAQLESSHWVRDGSEDAEVIVYEFTDPNCPYCHKFWQLARPWVDAGEVQLRHVMVGILMADSAPKAATILAAKDPSEAFAVSQHNYDQGGIQVAKDIPDAAQEKVATNNDLMKSLGYSATPTIVYKNDNGEVGVKQGLPQGNEVEAILGGPKP